MTETRRLVWGVILIATFALVLAGPWATRSSCAAQKKSGHPQSLKQRLDAIVANYPGSSVVSLDEKHKFVEVALDEKIGCVSEECSKMTGELVFKMVSADKDLIVLLKYGNGDSSYVDYAEAKKMYEIYRGPVSGKVGDDGDDDQGPAKRINEELAKRGIKAQ
jgi:hypothetical protein